jgi:hypothetical protein
MTARVEHDYYGVPVWLMQEYLTQLGGRTVGENQMEGDGWRAELRQGCHRHRIDLVPVVTDRPYADALAEYLTLRMRRA